MRGPLWWQKYFYKILNLTQQQGSSSINICWNPNTCWRERFDLIGKKSLPFSSLPFPPVLHMLSLLCPLRNFLLTNTYSQHDLCQYYVVNYLNIILFFPSHSKVINKASVFQGNDNVSPVIASVALEFWRITMRKSLEMNAKIL